VASYGLESIERRHFALTALRTAVTAIGVVVLYFVIPIDAHPHGSVVSRLAVALALFIAALLYEVRAIIRARHPILRAAVAMALIVPLFITLFSWTYLTMSRSEPAAFAMRFTRVEALYFTVTVFTTVGFGDIHAHTDPARVVVTIQMLSNLVVIAVVLRLLLAAGQGAFGRPDPAPEPPAAT
jgi:voltage-gated potassium channel